MKCNVFFIILKYILLINKVRDVEYTVAVQRTAPTIRHAWEPWINY